MTMMLGSSKIWVPHESEKLEVAIDVEGFLGTNLFKTVLCINTLSKAARLTHNLCPGELADILENVVIPFHLGHE